MIDGVNGVTHISHRLWDKSPVPVKGGYTTEDSLEIMAPKTVDLTSHNKRTFQRNVRDVFLTALGVKFFGEASSSIAWSCLLVGESIKVAWKEGMLLHGMLRIFFTGIAATVGLFVGTMGSFIKTAMYDLPKSVIGLVKPDLWLAHEVDEKNEITGKTTLYRNSQQWLEKLWGRVESILNICLALL